MIANSIREIDWKSTIAKVGYSRCDSINTIMSRESRCALFSIWHNSWVVNVITWSHLACGLSTLSVTTTGSLCHLLRSLSKRRTVCCIETALLCLVSDSVTQFLKKWKLPTTDFERAVSVAAGSCGFRCCSSQSVWLTRSRPGCSSLPALLITNSVTLDKQVVDAKTSSDVIFSNNRRFRVKRLLKSCFIQHAEKERETPLKI